MAMAQIMDAMNVISSVGGDAEFGKMFDQYIQKECEAQNSQSCETQNSQSASTNHEGADQSQTTTTTELRTVSQNENNQMYSQMHHQQQPYQNQAYTHQQNNGQNMQSNGNNPNPYYNPSHASQQSYQMQSHYPQMGHGHLQQYHTQQHYYASNGHSGQPNGYMMGSGHNHPNSSYPGQLHPSGNHQRPAMMLPVPSGSPTPNQHVQSSGIGATESMHHYGQPGQPQWSSGVGKIKAAPRAPKRRSKKGKDPNEPQKPASAYALFFRERQAMIKGQSPNASFGEISKIVASMWDTLEPEIKSVYKARTEDAKKDYLQALAAYRASGVATGDQAGQYTSPAAGYTYPSSDSPVPGNPTVATIQSAPIHPGIPQNIHTTQQPQETS